MPETGDRERGYPSPFGPFNAQLLPFAGMCSDMHEAIRARIDAMPDERLFGLVRASREVTTSNCWWATFQVAPIVREETEAALMDRGWRLARALVALHAGGLGGGR